MEFQQKQKLLVQNIISHLFYLEKDNTSPLCYF